VAGPIISTQSASWFDTSCRQAKQTQASHIRRDTGCPRRIGGTLMSDCTAPLRIKVHDAIDVIVALIVDYYGNIRDHYGDGRRAPPLCAWGGWPIHILFLPVDRFQKTCFRHFV
jgi:hypothetical protein